MKYKVRIKRDGTVEFLGVAPPGLVANLSAPVRHRFSEIVPANPLLRLAFRILRWLFGEGDRLVPVWTRGWRCRWEAMILKGWHRGMRKRAFGRRGRLELIEWEEQVWRTS